MSKLPVSFEEFLGNTLPWIDEQLGVTGIPLQHRPFNAACQIVDVFVTEVSGDTKEDYLEKRWFAVIFQWVHKWYKGRYGEALTRPRHPVALGVVTYYGTPYLIRVPLVFAEPGENGTAWIWFPNEVLPTESPLKWIETPPPLDSIQSRRRQALELSVRNLSTALRQINLDLKTADLVEENQRGLAGCIIRHLDKAASDIVSDERENFSLAIWDLHMACEKPSKFIFCKDKSPIQ